MENNLSIDEISILMIAGIIVMLALAFAFTLFYFYMQRRVYHEQVQNQQLQLQYQEELLQRTLAVQEEERRRIAKDLHDDVGARLNVLALSLHSLGRQLKGDPNELAPALRELNDMVGGALDTTRRISHELLPPVLEKFGLVPALEELCEGFARAAPFALRFELPASERPLDDPAVSLAFFRVAQELLSNAVKHAQASEVVLRLYLGATAVRLDYADDGRGYDPQRVEQQQGLGTYNMESRLKMIGATRRVQTAPGQGLRVQISYAYADHPAVADAVVGADENHIS